MGARTGSSRTDAGAVVSARKATRRPKARKEKVVEVSGHKLTPTQHREYLEHLETIKSQFPNWQSWQQDDRARSDCLYRWRPSVKAADFFKHWDPDTLELSNTISSLRSFMFRAQDPRTVAIGNDLIKRCADRLDVISACLRRIHGDIAKELEP